MGRSDAALAIQLPSDSPRWPNAASIVRTLVALLLITAAGLKAYVLMTDPLASRALGPRWFGVLTVEFEFLLGAWLLSGLYPRFATWGSILTFTIFALVSFRRGIAGETSCHCFGNLPISPWYTFGLDIAVVSALIMIRPSASAFQTSRVKMVQAIATITVALIIGGIATVKMLKPSWEVASSVLGLICENNSYDFGTINLRDAGGREHLFLLKNTGTHPVRIKSTESTCGCTVAAVPVDAVPPSGVVEVSVKVDWSAKPGRRMEEIHLRTDDPARSNLVLSVSGIVHAVATLSVTKIDFGMIDSDQTASRSVVVRSAAAKDFSITSIETSSKLVSIKRIDTSVGSNNASAPSLSGSAGAFLVTFTPEIAQGGTVAERVVFNTNLPEQKRLTLLIQAHVQPPLIAMPASLLFRRNKNGYEPQVINIAARNGQPTAESSDSDFLVSIQPGTKLGTATASVRYAGKG